jgi:hypothetical protein
MDALMTDQKPRSCLRCGTDLVAGLSFCPRCGLNNDEAGDRVNPAVEGQGKPADAPTPVAAPAPTSSQAPPATTTQPVGAALSALPRSLERGLGGNAKLWSAVIVVAALVIFDLLTRTQAGGTPGAAPGGAVLPDASAAAPSALIVGLTIESPRDGQVVATKDITVIGIAPPGLTITRDISFGLDQHATVDGTGHWAISVGLDNGENKLKFRIGDDHSTEREIRVTYTPPAQ